MASTIESLKRSGACEPIERVQLGASVEVSFDYGLELLVGGAVIRVGGVALLRTGADVIEFDAENAAAVAEKLVMLLHIELQASVSEDSELQFRDANDIKVMSVPPSSEYESWTATLSDGSIAVCGLDGQVAGWASS